MSRILLTGATGTIGSILLPLLIKKGHKITCIIRPKKNQKPFDRLISLLSEYPELKGITVMSGDVTKPFSGLSDTDLSSLNGKIDKILHCAASIKFDKSEEYETKKTNIAGTQNLLNIANNIGVKEFHYISTAYIAGDSESFSEEDRYIGQKFNNPYEESKFVAEELVRAFTDMANIKFSIYRPSVVVGDSFTGKTITFDGYYGFFKSIIKLVSWIENNRNNVDIKHNGKVYLPLRVDCLNTSTLNLVTSDWLASMLSLLVGTPASNNTYNLTHPNPPLVQWVIKRSLSHLCIEGVYFNNEGVLVNKSKLFKKLQVVLDDRLKRYGAYITHGPIFKSSLLPKTIGKLYYNPPDISEDLISILLNYAELENWGIKRQIS